MAAKLLN